MLTRRWFLGGLAASVAAPAVILRPQLLMPLRGIILPPTIEPEFVMMAWNTGRPAGIQTIGNTLIRIAENDEEFNALIRRPSWPMA